MKRFFRDRENRRAVTRVLLVSIVVVILAVATSLFFIYRSSGGSRDDSRVLTVAKAPESQATCITSPDSIPDYSGKDTIELNGNVPNFTEYDLENIEGELFSPLDRLGRCGTAIALLDRSMMPAEERGNIGMIRPSGWHTVRYDDLIEDKYLYNRCHLIAYAMTGQNSNELNLITGTVSGWHGQSCSISGDAILQRKRACCQRSRNGSMVCGGSRERRLLPRVCL